MGPKNVKKLDLFPPRIIKKAKRQKKYTSDRNEDQPSITKFLRGVPTPDNTIQQVNGTATPGSGPGLGGAVQIRSLDKIEKIEKLKPNKRKFTDKFSDNEDILREAKFVKLENSDALPHNGGQEVGEDKPPPALKSEVKTLKNRSNNQPSNSAQNLNIKHETLSRIVCGDEMFPQSQIIDQSDLITINYN